MMYDTTRYSARASLAAVGMLMRKKRIWKTVDQQVHIKQKVLTHTPSEKLLDAFIGILAGGQGLVEVNKRVRSDGALQRAFGRKSCADQSTISDTLNASTDKNVEQMRHSVTRIYRKHGQGCRHNYAKNWQLLDVDMTGMPAGRLGEGVEKGYYSRRRGTRGRQLGRVLATLYDEVVVDRLYPGKRQLEVCLQELVQAAEKVLALDRQKRERTVVRVDGGGGRDSDVNWLLRRGYGIVLKVKNWKRAEKLTRSVTQWHTDPKTGDRQVGWVEAPHPYERPTRQVGVRTPKKDGSWRYWVLVVSVTDEQLFRLARTDLPEQPTLLQTLLAALYAYDLRSGGVETSIRGSKQGLGITKRNKKLFAAQEMLVLLAQLAYNLVVWTRNQLAELTPSLSRYGHLRMVRDIFHISGKLHFDTNWEIRMITLNQQDELAAPFARGLRPHLREYDLCLSLGQI